MDESDDSLDFSQFDATSDATAPSVSNGSDTPSGANPANSDSSFLDTFGNIFTGIAGVVPDALNAAVSYQSVGNPGSQVAGRTTQVNGNNAVVGGNKSFGGIALIAVLGVIAYFAFKS